LGIFFPKEKLAEIRNRANIVEVISEYVTFKKVGRNYIALCPFHSEKTPSFNVSPEKQIFYCFGCQKGGDVIAFFQEINNLSFVEAVTELARRYGVSLPSPSSYPKETEREVFLEINDKVRDYFHQLLMERPEGERGRKYLTQRGIKPEIWRIFKLGYAPDGWDNLVNFLNQKKIPLELSRRLGLVVAKKEGGYFDCFRDRIIFPIFNLNGRTIGFGARVVVPEGNPKYLNSSDSIIYRKRDSVFGLPITRNSIIKDDRVIIVEGYFDLLTLFQAGINSVASPLGTALTSGHIQTLKRFTSNFFVVFDADEAGNKAALRSLEMFLDEGISPRVVILPPDFDPDEFVQQKGKEYFQKKLESAPFLIDYFIDKMIKIKKGNLPEGKVAAAKEILPIIFRIKEPIIQDDYIRKLSEKLEVKEERIRQWEKFSLASNYQKGKVPFSQPDENRREEFLLALILQHPEFIPIVAKTKIAEDIENQFFRPIFDKIISLYHETDKFELSNLTDYLDKERSNLVARLSIKEEAFGNIAESLKDCILQIKKNKIKSLKAELTRKIKKAQDNHDVQQIQELNKQKIKILQKEKTLTSSLEAILNC